MIRLPPGEVCAVSHGPRADREVPGRREDRRRCDGRGLQGPRPAPEPQRRDQDDLGLARRRPAVQGALQARGAVGRFAQSPEHRHGLRVRRRRGRDLHRDGVPRGSGPPRGDPREGARPSRPQARGDGADQRRCRLRARARDRPPRPQARQRPHPAERPHQDPRLRARQAGRVRADAQRNGDGDPALHVPRAAARAEGRRARRRLLAGRDLLRDPLGPARLREPADARGAGPPARPRARAAAQARPGDAGAARRHRRAGDGTRGEQSLQGRGRAEPRARPRARGARRRDARGSALPGRRQRAHAAAGGRRDDHRAAPQSRARA